MTSKQGAVLQSTRKTWSVPNGCWVISNRSVFLNAWALYNRCVLREVTSWNGKETAADADTKLTLVFQLLKVLEGGNADVLGLDPGRAANSGSRLHQTTPRSLPLHFLRMAASSFQHQDGSLQSQPLLFPVAYFGSFLGMALV